MYSIFYKSDAFQKPIYIDIYLLLEAVVKMVELFIFISLISNSNIKSLIFTVVGMGLATTSDFQT